MASLCGLLAATLLLSAAFLCQPAAATKQSFEDVVIFASQNGYPSAPPPGVDESLAVLTQAACTMGLSSFFGQNHCFHLVGLAQYEGLVPYLTKAVGPLTGPNPFRFPKVKHTLKNKKTTIAHALFTAFRTIQPDPQYVATFAETLVNMSCNPEDVSMGNTPAGVGNKIGLIVAEYASKDGANMDGMLPNHVIPGLAYSDYTGYVPVNTAYEFKHKDRWQPLRSMIASDISYVQQFVGAQACAIKPWSLHNATAVPLKAPGLWNKFGTKEYKAHADLVLEYSRKLAGNDTAKVLAEFVNIPHPNLVNIWWGAAVQFKWSFNKQVKYSFGLYVGAWDATVVTCCWKRTYDTPRPISLIRYSGLYKTVVAYAGPQNGNMEIPAYDWSQYTSETGPEPEYPSGSAMVHSFYGRLGARLTKSERLGIKVIFPKGGSAFEPGITPQEDTALDFPLWDSVGRGGYEGRQLGGIHFEQGAAGGYEVGQLVADHVYKWLQELFSGTYKGSKVMH